MFGVGLGAGALVVLGLWGLRMLVAELEYRRFCGRAFEIMRDATDPPAVPHYTMSGRIRLAPRDPSEAFTKRTPERVLRELLNRTR